MLQPRRDVRLQSFSTLVIRPQDLLILKFDFRDVVFVPPQEGGQQGRIVGSSASHLIVHFQPQHIAEQAFYQQASDGFSQTHEEIKAGRPPYPDESDALPDPGAVEARLAGPTRLAFRIPEGKTIPYTLAGLLDALQELPLSVVPVCREQFLPGCSPLNQLLQQVKPELATIIPPEETHTAIEVPYRLLLSPDDFARWEHAAEPVTYDDRPTELWHTRLGSHRAGEEPETGGGLASLVEWIAKPWRRLWRAARPPGDPRVRAIWSPDYKEWKEWVKDPPAHNTAPPWMALDYRDLGELVHLTSNYHIDGFTPEPVDTEQMMLTALGAWLRVQGDWELPLGSDLTVQQWRHEATLGRDHYVRVVYSGYMFPFGHRASLVKVTERKFHPVLDPDGEPNHMVAYLFQRMFILVRQPVRAYTHRKLPFRTVTVKTRVTPDLVNPNEQKCKIDSFDQEAFWPCVELESGETDYFQFHLAATDWEGRTVEFTAPLIFVSADVDNNSVKVQKVIRHYERLSLDNERCNRQFGGQGVAYAPSKKSGDTTLETDSIVFGAEQPGGSGEGPHFSPTMRQATVDIPAVKRLLGKSAISTIEWEKTTYTQAVGTGIGNDAEVFAEVTDKPILAFAPEKVGGLVAPNMDITGLSRSLGPVGGSVADIVKGKFSPGSVFPEIKLMGGIDLRKIIRGSLGVDKAPILVSVREGNEVCTSYKWELGHGDLVDVDAAPFFKRNNDTQFSLTTTVKTLLDGSPPSFTSVGELKNFSLVLMPGNKLVQIDFNSVTFTAEKDKKVDVSVELAGTKDKIKFLGALGFVASLSECIPQDGFSDPPSLEIRTDGIEVGFSLGIPTVAVGAMTLQNISLKAGFYLPLLGNKPMNFHFAFCERHQPFILTVMGLGGGGFFAMDVGLTGVTMVEMAIEFGASVALNLGVASGAVCVMGGFYYQTAGDSPSLTGYFRAAGALSVLGIVSISCEFYLGLTYTPKGGIPSEFAGKLWGQAKLTVKVKIAFFSKSVKLSLERTFAGSDPLFCERVTRDDWPLYCNAFAND